MTIQNMPFLQDTPLNFNDIELYLDLYASFIIKSRFFSRDEILPAFLERSVPERLNIIHSLMKKYHLLVSNMSEIGKIAQKNMMLRQSKEYYSEVFNVLKNLSEGGKRNQKYIDRLNESMAAKKPPKHVLELFNEHLKRFMNTTQESAEVNTLKTYLDWMVSVPYGVKTQDNLDLENVKTQLNKDHFGLDEVKDRILEFVAVGKMKQSIKEKILLLHGPPGVGKTSLAESIAKALGRSYERISLGGEGDSSVLKGHRRTYIGAYPGKIVTALKQCGSENCVIILDEIDKVGTANYHGDPQSNLLEILDPAQNKSFVDNYLDYSIDLSNVLFICTANNLNTISMPLLDRMDTITLSSYTNTEKKQIFYKHLLPKAMADSGIEDGVYFEIKDEVVDILINDYCREPGVRSLERYTKKIIDKVAYKIAVFHDEHPEETFPKLSVSKDNLREMIGTPIFEKEQIYKQAPPGVAVGLAYTQMGGSILFLEAKKSNFIRNVDNPTLKYTGTLGNVMSESMRIAYTFARKYLHKKGNNFLEKNEIHIHAPEGAIPKDGPSAGITIASALISLAMGQPIKAKVGMTGELSLNGKVMKIGGVKEKTLAGRREGLNELIFPKENEEDIADLKDYIKQGINFHFVSTYDEAYNILFDTVK